MVRVLGIASSTYYEWNKRAAQPSDRHVEDEKLLAEIVDIHTSSGETCGLPRVHAMLRRRGIRAGRKRVERLMRRSQLQGAFLRRKWRLGSTRQDRRATPAPDPVERNFTATEPDRGRFDIDLGTGSGWATRCARRSRLRSGLELPDRGEMRNRALPSANAASTASGLCRPLAVTVSHVPSQRRDVPRVEFWLLGGVYTLLSSCSTMNPLSEQDT
ncbi:IS3 family transposase [Nocardia brasiliensis]|uniref:IS3 family transposase n=1 Tax=Nocardia brasiliensis TaxID=37326 RepID=UPI003D8FADEE